MVGIIVGVVFAAAAALADMPLIVILTGNDVVHPRNGYW
jgi:hypothetical protein